MKSNNLIEKIVRCKECALRETFECPMFSADYSSYYEKIIEKDMTWEDGFCHYGVRKPEIHKSLSKRQTNMDIMRLSEQ